MGLATTNVRNVAITGHNGTGKTALMEQLLFYCDAIPKPESVESGKTISDFTEEEINDKISIHSSIAHAQWKEKALTFIDTPGTADFIGETIGALRAAEAVIMVVDARDGAQVETIKLWRRLDATNTPRAIFINTMDREHSDYSKVLDSLNEEFSASFVPVVIPMGSAEKFKGVINLMNNKAYTATSGEKEVSGEIPVEFASFVEENRLKLIEYAAEGADDLMEKYFESGTLDIDDIRRGLHEGLRNNRVVPVFCGATAYGAGISSLLTFIANNFPSPEGMSEEALQPDGSSIQVPFDDEQPFSALSFKTTIDQFSGKLSFIKVVTGVLTPETDFYVSGSSRKERASKLFCALGKKLVETNKLSSGEIGVIAKNDNIFTNSTLTAHAENAIRYVPLALPQPVYSVAITTDDKKSMDKMSESLNKVTEEDKTVSLSFNEETKETVLAGMGELHLNKILNKIREKQKIDIITRLPRIAYRETITKKSGICEFTHKKQSGGHGQYAKVMIEVEPLPRSGDYAFTNAVKGGSVSKGYVPGIEKGFHEAMSEGLLAGYPMVDIAFTLLDGKEHPVDSSEMAFKLAAKGAAKDAMQKAGPVLLEPYMRLEVFIENKYLGEILSDLSAKRGRVLGQDEIGHLQVVKAEVPQAELLSYSIDLKSMTSGTGSFELTFDHYEQISGKLADEVIKDAETRKASQE
ncbi:elongation factor G [Parasphaerochaeta coccoides]|uniref:Elongation factor G n=1 Tax=Parasphaerochaeta coccoides (strain ATCC BAA-1237 / DSM 17374 / SPN1) TaxID=760011 RepID=F4GKY7_PARC1|nr:elongation factor G [Parasphaerochaeta coccoides]AEC01900.1 translation elongation factor 2 (EF-2/EF-G) [Parasphaerochaeta coccoides DSM 17374]